MKVLKIRQTVEIDNFCNVNYFLSIKYIQQQIRSDCSNIDAILEPPEGQDEGVWKYEHLRLAKFFIFFKGSIIQGQGSKLRPIRSPMQLKL